MAAIKVLNMNGSEVGTMELNDNVFGVEYNEPLIHQTREGSRQDKESPGSCSRNTDAGGFPEEMACVLKKVPEVPFVPRPKTGRWLP